MKVKQPKHWETPKWVTYFTDFICSKDKKEWKDRKKLYQLNEQKHGR